MDNNLLVLFINCTFPLIDCFDKVEEKPIYIFYKLCMLALKLMD